MKFNKLILIFTLVFMIDLFGRRGGASFSEASSSSSYRGDSYISKPIRKPAKKVDTELSLIEPYRREEPELKKAIFNEDIDKIQTLLKNGDKNSKKGFIYLVLALKEPTFDKAKAKKIAQILLPYADIDYKEKETGKTALFKASELGSLPAVKLLIKLGADVNTIDDSGRTPLIAAAGADGLAEINATIFTALLKAGAQINKESDLNSAIRNPLIVDILLKNGAKVTNYFLSQATPGSKKVYKKYLSEQIAKDSDLIPDLANIVSDYTVD